MANVGSVSGSRANVPASPADPPVTSPGARWATPLAWVLFAVAVLTGGAALAAGLASGEQPGTVWEAPVIALIFPGVGALIASRQNRNAIGWIFIAIGFLYALSTAANGYAHHGLDGRAVFLPLAREAAWLANWVWVPTLALMMTYTLLLFPDGRPPSPRWRWVGWAAGAGLAIALVPFAIASWPYRGPALFGGIEDIPALRWTDSPAFAGFSLVGVSAVGALAALVVRFRRSRGVERQQLKWFVFAGVVFLLVAFNAFTPWPVPEPVMVLAVAGIPVAAGIAILKHRLYDVDLVINRSLVYGLLTAIVIGLYVGIVALLGRIFEPAGLGPSLAATGAVAVVFQPLRERVQRGINRLMYGERDDPYAILAKLGRRLEASLPATEILPRVAATIGEALRLPYVAIELRGARGFTPAGTHGRPGPVAMELPLVYRGELVGRLLVGSRARGEELSTADRGLLEDLARQAGVAVHVVLLASDLQRSRERLVLAREEERRRLRRDLHEGLGPSLAGVALQIETARGMVAGDPAAAVTLLERLEGEMKGAIRTIRGIVYGLRPPALDELGIVAALREEAARFTASPGLRVEVETPAELDALPAAVEVAAYRIATEAVANAARHSGAAACTVRLSTDEGVLVVEIADDGHGVPPEARQGVGISSMRERVAELGGSFTFGPGPRGGTRVEARLPLGD